MEQNASEFKRLSAKLAKVIPSWLPVAVLVVLALAALLWWLLPDEGEHQPVPAQLLLLTCLVFGGLLIRLAAGARTLAAAFRYVIALAILVLGMIGIFVTQHAQDPADKASFSSTPAHISRV